MRIKRITTVSFIFGILAGCGPEWTDDPGAGEQPLSSFPSKPTSTLLATGAGWKRFAISGTVLDLETNTTKQISGEEVYVVSGSGIGALPLPQVVRDDLSKDLYAKIAAGELQSPQEGVYFLHKNTALAVANGTLAKSAAKGTYKFSCSDYYKDYDKVFSFDEAVSHNASFSQTFNGSLLLAGNVKGMAAGALRIKIHKAWCVPYWASLVHLKVNGNLQAQGRVTAQGSFAGEWKWSKQVAKLPIGEIPFSIGPIPITLGFNLPVDLGLEASAKLTANLDGKVTASGSFDMTCTTGGCTGDKSYTHSFTAMSAPTVSITGRAKVKPWIQGALRAYVYDDGTIYGQIGVRPSLEGDLWGYTGNGCGDADNNGVNEWVNALTLDADVGIDVTARVFVDIPLLPKLDKDWQWNMGRWHVGFWNLGSGDALAPIFYRKIPTGNEVYVPGLSCDGRTFKGRMRPCWPYADKVDYHLDWKDGTALDFTLSPVALFTACKSFSFPQPGSVTLTAIRDAHGRNLNRSTTASTGYASRPTLPDLPVAAAP